MRIDKFLSHSGFGTRKEVKKLIRSGFVSVNGVVIKNDDAKIDESIDVIMVDGEVVNYQKDVYLMMNKPAGYISATEDLHEPTVMDLFVQYEGKDIFPVGRLDYNTSGMLIMTNDGDFAYKVTHPKHELTKTYRARVAGVLSTEKVWKLRNGVDIGGFVTSKARVDVIKGLPKSTIVEITIHEGKNRQVRKMFKAVGNNVQELERIAIGNIRLGRLAEGHYRKLTREEVEYLKNC